MHIIIERKSSQSHHAYFECGSLHRTQVWLVSVIHILGPDVIIVNDLLKKIKKIYFLYGAVV